MAWWSPNRGAFSYDWRKPDPHLGLYKWSTTSWAKFWSSMPPNTNGRNAIGGISSSATSVLNLSMEHKGLYKAVGAYTADARRPRTPSNSGVRGWW